MVGLMRMSTGAIARRADRGYLFTLSQWHAMSYVSDKLIVESGFVDPNNIFPLSVMKSVHYGMGRGIEVDVMEYKWADGTPVGALMQLHVSGRTMGYYAVRYET